MDSLIVAETDLEASEHIAGQVSMNKSFFSGQVDTVQIFPDIPLMEHLTTAGFQQSY